MSAIFRAMDRSSQRSDTSGGSCPGGGTGGGSGARLARVRRSQARADVTGMTRPPRDPNERAFLTARGGLGPLAERPNAPTREEPQ